ncbi:biopolymer transporter ExbD [Zhouia spongiae]|uniref:Biopolymer transporter ExbD n=1 Tax=Zhouia spongiae TaxID=2202721 RepID=A0ABY3YN95_9FLAO|nr:biopolymer transporter ExbD [Zhouia spongiae]UNY99301.1 biopolymer transporter ExbD [Zhouia spongiae]
MAKRAIPEVNAGSMADIAFLLLIFFLVTTTIETDSGINRKLPPDEEVVDPPVIKQKNIFTVVVNKNGQLLVEEQPMQLDDLRKAAMEFLDNGGGTGDAACSYCRGKKDPESSDNPTKAIISLQNDRETKYGTYIAVQNELVAAYNDLRNRYAESKYPNAGLNYVQMQEEFDNPQTEEARKDRLKTMLDDIKEAYPQKLSEAEPNKTN